MRLAGTTIPRTRVPQPRKPPTKQPAPSLPRQPSTSPTTAFLNPRNPANLTTESLRPTVKPATMWSAPRRARQARPPTALRNRRREMTVMMTGNKIAKAAIYVRVRVPLGLDGVWVGDLPGGLSLSHGMYLSPGYQYGILYTLQLILPARSSATSFS